MTRIIPEKELEKFIKSTGWVPGQEVPKSSDVGPVHNPVGQNVFSIDALVNDGKPFYSDKRDSKGNWIGVSVALREALDYVGVEGVVASMPYLIAGKSQAGKSNCLWKDWFTALSEENIGVDKSGKFVAAGNPVVVTVHGGGILTPDRIMQAYSEGLTGQNAAKLRDEEFDNLLEGVLPSGESVGIYTVEDVQDGRIPNLFGRYAVVMDFETAKSKSSGFHSKIDFMNNELVFARAGTLDYLDVYFDKAKDSEGKVGNWHRLNEIDPNQPQGRVLFLDNNYVGLMGYGSLSDGGRFVGVAPEAPRK